MSSSANDTVRRYLEQWAYDRYAPVDEVNEAMELCVYEGVDRQLAENVARVALYIRSRQGDYDQPYYREERADS